MSRQLAPSMESARFGHRAWPWLYCLGGLGLGWLCLAPFIATAASAKPPGDLLALEFVAESTGLDVDQLQVLGATSVSFPRQGLEIQEIKVADVRPEGDTFTVQLDPDGRRIDGEELRRIEIELAREERPEKFDRQQLEEWYAAGGEHRWVILWLREPPYDPQDRPEPGVEMSVDDVAEFNDALTRRRMAHVEQVVGPFLERVRAFVDHDVEFDPESDRPPHASVRHDYFSPVVYVRAPPDLLPELASLDEVDFAYLPQRFEPQVGEARFSVRTGYLESLYGLTGDEVRVGIIESGHVASSQWLAPVATKFPSASFSVDRHASAVAGIIASRHHQHRGVAPDARLWNSALSIYDNLVGGDMDSASRWGARLINLSFGGDKQLTYPSAATRKVEDLVHNQFLTIVAASGGPYSSLKIAPPADAYNAITVGAFLHNGTRDWSDDGPASFSANVNPITKHGDRHKPEVVAPGGAMTSIDAAGNPGPTPGVGTSYAAPQVTGTVAALMEANRLLAFWPEANKSILMATAWNDTDGNGDLRSKDGAGGIDGYRARQVATRKSSKGTWGGMNYENHAPKNLQLTQIYLRKGQPVRFAVSWANLAGTGLFGIPHHWDEPSLDLDLLVFAPPPNFDLVAQSASWDSNNEIVEFTPSEDGWYRVELRKHRVAGGLFPPPARYLGWAWFQNR